MSLDYFVLFAETDVYFILRNKSSFEPLSSPNNLSNQLIITLPFLVIQKMPDQYHSHR